MNDYTVTVEVTTLKRVTVPADSATQAEMAVRARWESTYQHQATHVDHWQGMRVTNVRVVEAPARILVMRPRPFIIPRTVEGDAIA